MHCSLLVVIRSIFYPGMHSGLSYEELSNRVANGVTQIGSNGESTKITVHVVLKKTAVVYGMLTFFHC